MKPPARVVVAQVDKEVSQTRDYDVAKTATLRAARPDPSLRKGRLLGMTTKVSRRQEWRLGRFLFFYRIMVVFPHPRG